MMMVEPKGSTSNLKAQAIREAERLIDSRRAKFDALMEEAAQVEEDVAEARKWLHFLKTGKDTEVRAAPTVKRQRALVSAEDFREALESFGDNEFTTADLAELTGMTPDAARVRLQKEEFADIGIVRKSKTTAAGRTPNVYRRSA